MLNPMLSNITTKNENILSLITKKEIMINGLKKKNGGRSEQSRKNFAMSAFVYSFWNQNNESFH